MNLIQLSNAVDAAETKHGARSLVAVQHGDHFYLNTSMGGAEIVAINPACEVRRVHIRDWDAYVQGAFANNFGGAFDRLVVCA